MIQEVDETHKPVVGEIPRGDRNPTIFLTFDGAGGRFPSASPADRPESEPEIEPRNGGHTTRLDVRPLEPRTRFEAIMAAFEELPAGGTLDLTIDHDPLCMYYTLKVTRGAHAFTFDYLKEGPRVWRVAVGRLA